MPQTHETAAKVSSVLGTSIVLSAFVLFAALLFVLSGVSGQRDDMGMWWAALGLIVTIDLIVQSLKAQMAARKDAITYAPSSTVGQVATLWSYWEIFRDVRALVMVALIFGFIGYVIYNGVLGAFTPTTLSWLILATYIVYPIMVAPVLAKVITPFLSTTRRFLPSYTLIPNGIEVDPHMMPEKYNRRFQVMFSELDEIRVFNSWQEAQIFLQTVGPDPKLALDSVTTMAQFLQGKIPKPKVYEASGQGINIFLKGPDLFYVVAVENKDVSDLVHAFEEYKKSL